MILVFLFLQIELCSDIESKSIEQWFVEVPRGHGMADGNILYTKNGKDIEAIDGT